MIKLSDQVKLLEDELKELREDMQFISGVICVNFCTYEGSAESRHRFAIWDNIEDFRQESHRERFVKTFSKLDDIIKGLENGSK